MQHSVVKDLVSGSAAGVCSIFVCHPLDTVRVRLQTDGLARQDARSSASAATSTARQYRGAVDCILQTARTEGLRGFYRGLAGPLAAQAVYKAVIFGAYSASSKAMAAASGLEQGSPLLLSQVAICGGFAGSVNALVVCPVELVRNRLMIERATKPSQANYSGPLAVVRAVRATEGGWRGMWRGLPSTVLRDGLGVAAYFVAFRQVHEIAQETVGNGHVVAALFAGACAGLAFWIVALPFDAVKSIVQTEQVARTGGVGRTLAVTRELFAEGGLTRLYRGIGIAAARGIPSAAIVFSVQGYVRRALDTA